ncbi:hypothetical protein [Bradyrhizobium sp. Y36]|uniref:hypothetical protein n=1 Tax=Bradyrhizobium sp. Y36 TaxID=2035447 RepID=UPI0011780567|nr:hypothetical protein [Bradyrhizobium sp. Y36]
MMALLSGGLASVLSGCGRPRVRLRYRLTLEVETPSGVRTGSSVLECTLYGPSMIPLPGDIGGSGNIGEAPTVDLGGGRFLFAVLADPLYRRDLFSIVSKVLAYPELRLGPSDEGTMERMKRAAETRSFAVLLRQNYPMLVTFADVNNPSSIAEVSPDNLAGSFGAGYSLKRITFEAVDEKTPLTTGFQERFPAIANHRGVFRTRPPTVPRDQDLDAILGASSFFTGAAK